MFRVHNFSVNIYIALILLFLVNAPSVEAQNKTIEQLQRMIVSLKACRSSLTDVRCDMDILDPEAQALVTRAHELENRVYESQSKINSGSAYSSSGGCYDSSITKPTPFMGNNGEIFKLSDGSLWEVKYEYEYMYEYYPSVIICPSRNLLIVDGEKLNVVNLSGEPVSGGGKVIESNIQGSWNGWSGDTIVKLTNGQIWEQAGAALSLSLGLGNEVLIFEKNNTYHMQVEDEDEAVAVRRLK